MSPLLPAALEYARRGWQVFPVHGIHNARCTCGRGDCSSPGKHPLVGRGVRDATTEEGAIRVWWKHWRLANVAIATGSASGVIVIDVDVPEGERSLELLEDMGPGLLTTLSAITGSGGRHLYFRAPEHQLGNAVGTLPGVDRELPGIDLRAEGGYVLAPPSLHISGGRYTWCELDAELADVPSWLRQVRRESIAYVAAPATFTGDGSAYGLAVLSGELDRLRVAPTGRRNHTLNQAAFSVARVVAGGELLEPPARSALLAEALCIGLTEHESLLTIDSAFAAGSRSPRSAPHRLRS